jgi:hypothetical protein
MLIVVLKSIFTLQATNDGAYKVGAGQTVLLVI